MQFVFLVTSLFLLLIVAIGVLVDLILIGSLELKKENSPKIKLSVKNGPLYFALGATVYTFFGYILSINGIKLSINCFLFLLLSIILINLFLFRTNLFCRIRLNNFSSVIRKFDRKKFLFQTTGTF